MYKYLYIKKCFLIFFIVFNILYRLPVRQSFIHTFCLSLSHTHSHTSLGCRKKLECPPMQAQEEHAQCSWLWVGWLIASVLPVVMKWNELPLMCLLWLKKRKETKPFVNSNVSQGQTWRNVLRVA